MYPVLFEIGGVPIYSHGFFVLLGLLVGLAMLVYESRRRKWPKEEVIPITLAAIVGGMIGARLSILFFNGFETAPIVLNFFLSSTRASDPVRFWAASPARTSPVTSRNA